MSRLPQPGERARILPSEYMDYIGATDKTGVVLDERGVGIVVELDDASGVRWRDSVADKARVVCTISEVELAETERTGDGEGN